MLMQTRLFAFISAMCAVVALSNYLVQFPFHGDVGGIELADLLTWGAFTYPVAFLVTDLANRKFGAAKARIVVIAGFALAVMLSIWLATPRIAMASGSAFLIAQLLDVQVFDRFRASAWWKAPLLSTLIGSLLDTTLFFSLAFSSAFEVLGANDAFAIETAPLLGVLASDYPRWVSWALGDLGVKLLVGLAMLVPYRVLSRRDVLAAS